MLAKTKLVLFSALLLAAAIDAQATKPFLADTTGFGADTPAGRGGRVLRVTTLDAAGPGSLRAALETKGPRIVVFEVGGIIDLDRTSLVIAEPYVTVAGQTAPSPGITIVRGPVRIATHDVLLQHLRVRPGDAGQPKKSGWEPDGISTTGGNAHDVVIDHCSISWAVDENLSASGERTKGPDATSHRITFRHCIVAEGLHDSSHAKGPHSKGSLIHDHCRDIAIVGNLYAHNVRRNPLFKALATGVVVNNVIYDPAHGAIRGGVVESEWKGAAVDPQPPRFCVVGNVMLHGPSTREGLALVSGLAQAFVEDNVAFDREGEPAPLVAGDVRILEERPLWPEGLVPLPAKKVLEHVTAHAGARPRDRDATDARIVRQVREGTGRIIDSQDDVGGYPVVEPTRHTLEIPETDIEEWLAKLARELE